METSALLESDDDLPDYLSIRYDRCNRKIFLNHLTMSTSWEDPTLPALPEGWCVSHDSTGKIMYLELKTLFMTYERPTSQNTISYGTDVVLN